MEFILRRLLRGNEIPTPIVPTIIQAQRIRISLGITPKSQASEMPRAFGGVTPG
jgi:hypothetical protein